MLTGFHNNKCALQLGLIMGFENPSEFVVDCVPRCGDDSQEERASTVSFSENEPSSDFARKTAT